MAGHIVLFGATGYTGRLTAEAMLQRGDRPLLAARNASRVEAMASELGGLEWAVADVERPDSISALLGPGDVLVSTVGPFLQWGEPAVQAAIGRGTHYLDSTGEGTFIREVFEQFGPAAEAAGTGLVTAFGYDYVPGNLAGALALREAGPAATRVDVGYFFTGSATGGMSGGTRASAAGMVLEPAFTWRDGRLVSERGAARARSFQVEGRSRMGISIGTSEHFALPRLAPQLRDVNVYLGWFGPLSRAMQGLSRGTSALTQIPGARTALQEGLGRLLKGSTGGPDALTRARSGSHAVAVASDPSGREVAEIHVAGPNAYTLTGALLAWGAAAAAEGGLKATGALGPAEGFGLDELVAGCAEAGLKRV